MSIYQRFKSFRFEAVKKANFSHGEIYHAMMALFALRLFVLYGCALFTSHYDAVSYEHFTMLKAFHLKFIDDFTSAENKQWDDQEFKQKRDQGELKFREALEYEKEKKKRDSLREKALNILYDQFKADCKLLEQRAREGKFFFSEAFAKELKEELEQNYYWAIKGELSRMKAPGSN